MEDLRADAFGLESSLLSAQAALIAALDTVPLVFLEYCNAVGASAPPDVGVDWRCPLVILPLPPPSSPLPPPLLPFPGQIHSQVCERWRPAQIVARLVGSYQDLWPSQQDHLHETLISALVDLDAHPTAANIVARKVQLPQSNGIRPPPPSPWTDTIRAVLQGFLSAASGVSRSLHVSLNGRFAPPLLRILSLQGTSTCAARPS